MKILNKELLEIESKVYKVCNLKLSNLEIDLESKAYSACKFQLNESIILSRTAKITPKKIGQFVSFWKRNNQGNTEAFNEKDKFDFYVINLRFGDLLGQFIFPKSILIKKGILSTDQKEGKRGFRVYPSWDITINKQAKKTQEWQLKYFYTIDDKMDYSSILKLYKSK